MQNEIGTRARKREREREILVDKGMRLTVPRRFPVSLLIFHFQQFYVFVMRRVVRIIGFFFVENDPLVPLVGNGKIMKRDHYFPHNGWRYRRFPTSALLVLIRLCKYET